MQPVINALRADQSYTGSADAQRVQQAAAAAAHAYDRWTEADMALWAPVMGDTTQSMTPANYLWFQGFSDADKADIAALPPRCTRTALWRFVREHTVGAFGLLQQSELLFQAVMAHEALVVRPALRDVAALRTTLGSDAVRFAQVHHLDARRAVKDAGLLKQKAMESEYDSLDADSKVLKSLYSALMVQGAGGPPVPPELVELANDILAKMDVKDRK